jgi:phenylalanine-4-hydroxylase
MLRQLNDTAKHGAAAVDEQRPERADWTIDQGWSSYTAQDHAVWKTLFERQRRLLPGRACDEFVAGMKNLPIGADQIPNFEKLSDTLMKHTGWQVVAVPGLVPDDVFFEHLANRRFPSGQFIRKPDQLDYLEEPDVFHDVFGHVPMLMNPVIADYIQAYGEGGPRAKRLGVLENLARVYWYTVEFDWFSSTTACESTARASHPRRRKRCSRSRMPPRTGCASISSV